MGFADRVARRRVLEDAVEVMDRVNQRWYSSPSAVQAFARDDLLEPTVVMLLVSYHDAIVGREVLDLGVGAGRTTRYLSALTARYVGIDYSPAMVAYASRRFPSSRVEWGDARDLAQFEDARFDFVLFSAAGIDTLDHESRLRALREVARVLRPGGLFAFSTHNRDYRGKHDGPRVARSRNPVTQLANMVRWALAARNHAVMTRLECERERYELVNDSADGYRLLHYYIRHPDQRRQLADVGLTVERVFDADARELSADDIAPDSAWLWYVARRSVGRGSRTERRRADRRTDGVARAAPLAEQRR